MSLLNPNRGSSKVIRDFQGRDVEGQNANRVPNVTTLPLLEKRGAIVFHLGALKYWDGTNWIALGASAGATLANAGTGISLVSNGLGPALSTLGLVAGAGVTITPDLDNNLVISAPGGGGGVTATSLGVGSTLIGNGTGPALTFKSLVAGANITLTSDADTVTISSTGGSGPVTTLTPSGTGMSLIQDGVGPDLGIFTLGVAFASADLASLTNAFGIVLNITRNIASVLPSTLAPVPPQRAGIVAGTGQGPAFEFKGISSGSGTGNGGAPGTGLANTGLSLIETATDITLFTHGYIRNAIITASTGTAPKSFYAAYNSIYKKNGVTTGEVSTINYVTNLLDATMTFSYPNIPFYLFHFTKTFEFELFSGTGPTTLNISMPNVWDSEDKLGAVTFDFVRRNVVTHTNLPGQPPLPYGSPGTPVVTYVGFNAGTLTATWTIANPTFDLLVRVGLV